MQAVIRSMGVMMEHTLKVTSAEALRFGGTEIGKKRGREGGRGREEENYWEREVRKRTDSFSCAQCRCQCIYWDV